MVFWYQMWFKIVIKNMLKQNFGWPDGQRGSCKTRKMVSKKSTVPKGRGHSNASINKFFLKKKLNGESFGIEKSCFLSGSTFEPCKGLEENCEGQGWSFREQGVEGTYKEGRGLANRGSASKGQGRVRVDPPPLCSRLWDTSIEGESSMEGDPLVPNIGLYPPILYQPANCPQPSLQVLSAPCSPKDNPCPS